MIHNLDKNELLYIIKATSKRGLFYMGFSLEDLKNNRNKGLITTTSTAKGSLQIKRPNVMFTSKTDIDRQLDEMTKKTIVSSSLELAKNTAEIIFIIDRSGSVAGTEEVVSVGFKNFLTKIKQLGLPTTISTILFSTKVKIVHDNLDVKDVEDFSYFATGGTSLYDTLLSELTRIEGRQNMTGFVPKDTFVITMTDGRDENSRMPLEAAQKLIERLRSRGWHFIFLGANQNAKEIAEALSMDPLLAEKYVDNLDGLLANFDGAYNAVKSIRMFGKADPDWAKPIVENRLSLDSKKQKGEDGKRLLLGGKK